VDDEVGPVGCTVEDVDEDIGAPGRRGATIPFGGRTRFETGPKSLPGFDIEPAVDPNHLPFPP
jgi:hypothetical protein